MNMRSERPRVQLFGAIPLQNRRGILMMNLFHKHQKIFKILFKIANELTDTYRCHLLGQKYYVHKLRLAYEEGAQLVYHAYFMEPKEPFFPAINERRLNELYSSLIEYIQEHRNLTFSPPGENNQNSVTYTIFIPLDILLCMSSLWYEFNSYNPRFSTKFIDMSISDQVYGNLDFRFHSNIIQGP